MDCSHIREALSARLDGEDPGLAGVRIDAHVAGCPACATWAAELGVLHRMTRVRAAEAVPDLSAAILRATQQNTVPARAARPQPVSTTRWAP